MKMNTPSVFKQLAWTLIVLFIILIGTLVVALYSSIWTINESFSQLFGILAGASLASSLTILYIGSTAHKEKEVITYNIKVTKYSNFIEKMYSMLGSNNDEIIFQECFEDLRKLVFKEIVFYLNTDEIKEMENAIKIWKDNNGDAQKQLTRIVEVLRANLVNASSKKTDIPLYNFWQQFNVPKDEGKYPVSGNFWHFCLLGPEQIKYFEKHKNDSYQELSLIEYGESWRTETLKKIVKGDIVFLFKRGGFGYIGVFRVEGHRIFKFNIDGDNEIVNGEQIQDIDQIKKDISDKDIYHSKSDGASLCANLIVTPLVYIEKGVSHPGGIYRKTISRYDETYGKKLLGRFLYAKNNLTDELKIKCNEEMFNDVKDDYKILSARKDNDGRWIDN